MQAGLSRATFDVASAPGKLAHGPLLSPCPKAVVWQPQVGVKDGVVLLTYSSLISAADSGASRLQQLVDWCKPGFDGLIVFDGESHSPSLSVLPCSAKP